MPTHHMPERELYGKGTNEQCVVENLIPCGAVIDPGHDNCNKCIGVTPHMKGNYYKKSDDKHM